MTEHVGQRDSIAERIRPWSCYSHALGLLMFLAGCTSPRLQALDVESFQGGYLSFIRDGETTREQVLLRLGDPSGFFEDGRILTFAIAIDGEDVLRILTRRMGTVDRVDWRPGIYSVVVVFDDAGVLERHSVIGGE